ncbi:MAG: dynamin family protein [Ottowia sp.]
MSTEDIKIRRQALAEQKRKTEELKMVLAVVGTMKAGKSTTINAIVGREILPNRNRPMTALPTLIEHKRGQKTPVLHFEKRQPIEELAARLRKKIEKMQPGQRKKITDGDTHLEKTLANLSGKNKIAASYEGEENIFRFLEWLNDMVRLAKALDDQFPFDEYRFIDDFPCIEVEFFHLASMPESGPGKLLILDTPGFNEAGQQEHLLPVMQEQLKKATAILAVLDYTQLKSDAEGKLRAELNAIAEQSKDNLFALVNKFDQKKSGSDSEDVTREYVAHDLLNNTISEQFIFPVSSHWAYLSQQARVALAEGGIQWQPGQPESWIDDFGKIALGELDWEEEITNTKKIERGAHRLWTKSRFDAPLENVIRFVYRNAAYQVIKAAAAELMRNAPDLVREVRLRLQTHDADPEDLQDMIDKALENIHNLNGLQEKNKNNMTEQLDTVKKEMETAIEDAEKQIQETVPTLLEGGINLKEYFRPELIGIIERHSWYKKLNAKEQAEFLRKKLDEWLELLPNNFKHCGLIMNALRKASVKNMSERIIGGVLKTDFVVENKFNPRDPDSWRFAERRVAKIVEELRKSIDETAQNNIDRFDDIIFKNEDNAIGVRNSLSKIVAEFIGKAGKSIENAALKTVNTLDTQMVELRKKVERDISTFGEHASKVNLSAIDFHAPENIRLRDLEYFSGLDRSNLISRTTQARTEYKEQDGFTAWLARKCDLFGNNWGYDKVETEENCFAINENKLKEELNKKVNQAIASLRDQVETGFIQPVQQSSDDFFAQVLGCFSHVRQILENGMNDRLRAKDEAERLIKELQQMQREAEDTQQGANEIKNWAGKHTTQKAA